MQIVIDIPKEAYEQIIEAGELDYLEVITAIENGTPLPKGHGRLVDYDDMKEIAFDYGRYTESALSYIKPRVLIEADKAEKEHEA